MKKKDIEARFYNHPHQLETYRTWLEFGKELSEEEIRKIGRQRTVHSDICMLVIDSIEDLLSSIQELCKICYLFGLNPLPKLRILFPRFQWHYIESVDFAFSEISGIDPEYVFSTDCNFSFVCARKKGHNIKSEYRYFVASESDINLEECDNDHGLMAVFRKLGYKIISKHIKPF